MRSSLLWALAGATLLSIFALWTTNQAPGVVASVEPRLREHARQIADPLPAVQAHASDLLPPLPERLPLAVPLVAKRDVFATKVAPQPQPATVAAPAPTVPQPAPAPRAPSLNLRFVGSMVDPDGKRLVYLARGDVPVLVGAGDRLSEGYVVESLEPDAIVLVYPPLNERTTIPIPPPQER